MWAWLLLYEACPHAGVWKLTCALCSPAAPLPPPLHALTPLPHRLSCFPSWNVARFWTCKPTTPSQGAPGELSPSLPTVPHLLCLLLPSFSPSSLFLQLSLWAPQVIPCLLCGNVVVTTFTASCFVAHRFHLCCCVRRHGSCWKFVTLQRGSGQFIYFESLC